MLSLILFNSLNIEKSHRIEHDNEIYAAEKQTRKAKRIVCINCDVTSWKCVLQNGIHLSFHMH